MKNLVDFYESIKDFNKLSKGQQVDLFAYFLQINRKMQGFTPLDVKNCFKQLNLPPHSNINQYLSSNSGNNCKRRYFKRELKYLLQPRHIDNIKLQLEMPVVKTPSKNLIDLGLFAQSRGYISKVALQIIITYDDECYDACSVMIRRLIETLIIECYERKGLSNVIKEPSGEFKRLEELINIISTDIVFNISRNTKAALPKFKNIGDLSAHNRRYTAKKSDIEPKKEDLRLVMEELLHIIDYPTWK